MLNKRLLEHFQNIRFAHKISFKHSSRKLPLKLSTKPFCILCPAGICETNTERGLPGAM